MGRITQKVKRQRAKQIFSLYSTGSYTYEDVADLVGLAKSTVFEYVRRERQEQRERRERQREHHRRWWHSKGSYRRKLKMAGMSLDV